MHPLHINISYDPTYLDFVNRTLQLTDFTSHEQQSCLQGHTSKISLKFCKKERRKNKKELVNSLVKLVWFCHRLLWLYEEAREKKLRSTTKGFKEKVWYLVRLPANCIRFFSHLMQLVLCTEHILFYRRKNYPCGKWNHWTKLKFM